MVWGATFEIPFSKIISIARCKDVWVADHMQFRNGNIYWNICFTRPVHDWEVEVVFDFFGSNFIYTLSVNQVFIKK
jgi:hypothetical protein